ncbi:Rqc2 family fibronectin-binding protein [Hutsoniella sourekii]|uniref:Rqc2 family fibronectin-binding protein n=1 Tax=Hutsoniella sourekii TaxID=87650 RepID=UPI00048368DE|nr:NFACT RNA binding domain-containing protein [Hutsoniella sourekii]
MSFDGFFTRGVVHELQDLVGGRINKIFQPYEQDLHLVIRRQRQNFRLNASIHPQYYRLHLSQERPNNPIEPYMFCMVLRKHIEGATIQAIRQVDNDRIIVIDLSGTDELGDRQNYQLIFELMGRHSNILLINHPSQTIIDCMKHVPAYMNSYRSLHPGADYLRPPLQEGQVNLFDLDFIQLSDWANQHQEDLLAGQAGRLVQGLSRLGAQEIGYQIKQGQSAFQALDRLMKACQEPQASLIQTDKNVFFYLLPLEHFKGQIQSYESLSQLVEAYFQEKVRFDRIKQVSGDLTQQVQQLITKRQHKLKNLAKDRLTAAKAPTYQLYGELLSAYAYQVPKGSQEVRLANYYQDNQEVTIPLDPRLSAIDNSQAYFKKYSKYRDSLKYIDREEAKGQAEIDYLEGILVQLANADIEDLPDIKHELIDQGFIRSKKDQKKKRSKSKSKPRQFQSSDGSLILVGRNNQQNDQLSMKSANKNHWWLHTKNIPGSHVIIQDSHPSQETFIQAAQLAAYYSKSQQSANVPVDTVQVKHLRKPNGAKPGYVIYEGQETLYVTPEASLVQALAIQK